MRKTLGLAVLVAATAGVFLPASPASADHCPIIQGAVAQYKAADARLHDLLPDLPVIYCQD
jgi:hypothetical protein